MEQISGPFRASEAVAAGDITRGRLAGPGTTRLFPNVHGLTGHLAAPDDLLGRTREAVLYVRGDPPVVGGYAATELHGAACSPSRAPVELIVGTRRVRPQPGLTIRRDVLDAGDVVEVDGLLVTTPKRTAWDLVRRLGFIEGVVALDALARVGRFEPGELLKRPVRARGSRRVATAVEASDPRAGSRPETVMRLVMAQSEVPTPTLQSEVRDAQDFFVAYVDFGWEEFKVAAEYQGDGHRSDQRRWQRDQSRLAELASCGWIVVPCTAEDLRYPLAFVRRLLKTLALRGCVL